MSLFEPGPLFCKKDLDDAIRYKLSLVPEEVDSISKEQFLATNEEALHDHLFSSMSVEPLTLYEEKKHMDQEETKFDVTNDHSRNPFREPGPILIPGIKVTISIPWTGDGSLWNLNTSSINLYPPIGKIREADQPWDGYLDIVIEQPVEDDPKKIKDKIEETIANVNENIMRQKGKIEQYEKELSDAIRDAINKRGGVLKKHEELSDILDIPLRRREEVPDINQIPLKRRVIKPLPKASHGARKKDYRIPEEEYKHILDLIRQFSKSFETNPNTFVVHGEEDLRDFILAILNIHYKGSATGETFRKNGKTDINIPYENRAAFVAECKVWHGKKELHKGIGQLFGYLTWRDCKTSFVIFNKDNSDFSALQTAVPEAFNTHPQCIRQLNCEHPEEEWRFLFSFEGDSGREIIIHVFLFDLYVSK